MNMIGIRFYIAVLLLSASALLVYVPGLGGGFIFDDKPNIVDNGSIQIDSLNLEDLQYAAYSFQPGGGSRALSMLSFSLDYLRGGLDARVFKSTNILIHGMSVCLLMLFLRELLLLSRWTQKEAEMGALSIGLVWALHPLQVSTVLYVVQRMQLLGSLFLILALWLYLKMRVAQIKGGRSRRYALLVGLSWLLAWTNKEDAIVLPLCTFLLEFTVLKFRAEQSSVNRLLRTGYALFFILGFVAYVGFVIPHYWHWESYPGRDFSSYERLLTQGRVLLMYLGQILVPLPESMPFFYDDYTVSRGVLSPISTAISIFVLCALIVFALRIRSRWPLVAFGILFFFAGHFVSSNVIPLELAFEHRNYFPQIGILIALLEFARAAWSSHWGRAGGARILTLGGIVIVAGMFSVGLARSYSWGEPLRLAQSLVTLAPTSERAWLALGGVYIERGGLDTRNPWLDQAIETCERGGELTDSAPLFSNVVMYKTVRGDVSPADWNALLRRLSRVSMSPQNRNILWVMLNNIDGGIRLDERGVRGVIDIYERRANFSPEEYLRVGAYIFNETSRPRDSYYYLSRAVELSEANDPSIEKMLKELGEAGRSDWVLELGRVKKKAERLPSSDA